MGNKSKKAHRGSQRPQRGPVQPQPQLQADFDTSLRHLAEKLTQEVADAARWRGVAEAALQRAAVAEAKVEELTQQLETEDEAVVEEEADSDVA